MASILSLKKQKETNLPICPKDIEDTVPLYKLYLYLESFTEITQLYITSHIN